MKFDSAEFTTRGYLVRYFIGENLVLRYFHDWYQFRTFIDSIR